MTNKQKTQSQTALIDQYLIRIGADDLGALAGLYRLTSPSVYGFALSILKNPSDAEDVLQDVFLAIARSAEFYKTEGKPLAWMLTIARNFSLMKLRETKNNSPLAQADWQPYLAGQESMTAEDKMVLMECLNTLSDQERQIVILQAVAGFKHREIAKLLSLPLSTVLSKYRRALLKLKRRLMEGDKEDEK